MNSSYFRNFSTFSECIQWFQVKLDISDHSCLLLPEILGYWRWSVAGAGRQRICGPRPCTGAHSCLEFSSLTPYLATWRRLPLSACRREGRGLGNSVSSNFTYDWNWQRPGKFCLFQFHLWLTSVFPPPFSRTDFKGEGGGEWTARLKPALLCLHQYLMF